MRVSLITNNSMFICCLFVYLFARSFDVWMRRFVSPDIPYQFEPQQSEWLYILIAFHPISWTRNVIYTRNSQTPIEKNSIVKYSVPTVFDAHQIQKMLTYKSSHGQFIGTSNRSRIVNIIYNLFCGEEKKVQSPIKNFARWTNLVTYRQQTV